MRNFATALIVTTFLILTLAACEKSSSGTPIIINGALVGGQSAYDITVTGPGATGVQANQPFSVDLSFTAPGTTTPVNLMPGEGIAVSIVSGPGALTGATGATGNGTPNLTFGGIILNASGTYVLQFTGPTATGPANTISFVVSPQLDLEFFTVPTTVGTGSAFSVTIRTVDNGTGNPLPPPAPVNITLALATGTGTLSGTLTRTLTAASSIDFTGLSYTPAGTITLQASAPGFATVVSSSIVVTNLSFVNQPGPFVALKSVRVNHAYTDSIAYAVPNTATSFAVMGGSTLPAGLSLNTSNGTISGTPTATGSYEFSLYAVLTGTQAQVVRCALAVFSTAETEITSGQDFSTAGPHSTTGPITETYTFTSFYDGVTYPTGGSFNCRIQYYYPNFATAPSPAPVLIHHRGRGFSMPDYDNLGAHVASYGFIFISIEDYQSFSDGGFSGQSPISAYDSTAERGHISGSAFQQGVMEWVIAKNTQTGHALQNRVDDERIFMSGHSRGGGATHNSHLRSAPYTWTGTQRTNINIRGTIYFMAFDQRFFTSTVAGSTTVIPMPTAQPRLPSMIIAAENDGDLIYPICDEFIDRATGPTTFATIYGGCHNYLGDTNSPDGSPYITRAQEQARIFNMVVAFLKRWSDLDLSLDGLLYNNEKAGSTEVGIQAYRNMAERVTLDDHQGGNKNNNSLGGTNSLSAGTWDTTAAIYPTVYGSNHLSMGLKHAIFSIPASTTATYTSTIPAASQDLSATKRFMFRIGSVDSASAVKGFDWVTVRVRLTDAQNDIATVTLFDRTAPSSTYLPDHPGSGSNVFDRMVDANVPLSVFTTATPALTLSALTKVELIFESATGATRQLYIDDLRFE